MLLSPALGAARATRSSSATAARPTSTYPDDPDALSDVEWADYLFMRDNPRGPFAERWFHTAGCRRWFNAIRDTATLPVRGRVPPRRGAAGVKRLETGGALIDRSRPIRFTFDGAELEGFAGDTLASALLANGVDVVCRSPIQGRPRGVMTAGVEEPSAFVEVSAPRFEPIVAATTVELVDGVVATGRPGVGRLPLDPPAPPRVEHRHAHVELLVVGGGHDGIYLAEEAAAAGDRVLVVEREPTLAGVGMDWAPPEGVTVRDQDARRSASTTTDTWSSTSGLIRSSASGTFGRAAWCSRPEAMSGRSRSRTTTDRA